MYNLLIYVYTSSFGVWIFFMIYSIRPTYQPRSLDNRRHLGTLPSYLCRVFKFLIGNIPLVSRPTFVVTIATYIHILLSFSSFSLSSRLFIDILQPVLLRSISYPINNGIHATIVTFDSSIKKEEKKHMYRCVKICFTSAVLLADCIDYNTHRSLYSLLTLAGRSTTDGMRWIQISLDNTVRRVPAAKWTRLSALACVRGVHATSII